MKYFKPESKISGGKLPRGGASTYARQVAFSAGAYFSSKSYEWVDEEVGGWSAQLDYRRKGKAGSYFAKSYQLEYQKFQFSKEESTKVSFLMSFIFPRSLSFPVYIGAGVGPGVFLHQKADESWVSLDYKGFLGFQLSGSHGQFFVEGGMKSHLLVLSNGQFSGWFVSSGVAYKF